MALQRQELELPLSGGLLQQADERILPVGRWATVNNMLPVRNGALTKRQGYGLIPTSTFPAGDLVADVVDVIDSRGDEVLAYGHRHGATRMWSWSPTLERWVDKDDVSPCSAIVRPVASAYVGTLLPRLSVTAAGARAWSWQYVQTAISLGSMTVVQRVEEANGTVRLDEDDLYGSVGILNTEQVSVGDEVATLYTDAGGPLFSYVTDTATGAVTGPIAVVTPNPVFRFAACPYDATTYLLAWVDSGVPGSVTIWQLQTDGTLISGATHALGAAISAVCIDAVAGIGAVLSYWDVAGNVSTLGLVDATWAISWGPSVDVVGPVFVQALGTCIDASGASTTAVSYGAPASPVQTDTANRDAAGVVGVVSSSYNVIIEHQPFRRLEGAYVTMTQIADTGDRYGATCLVQIDTQDAPSVVATLIRYPGQAGAGALFAVGACLARAIAIDSERYILPVSVLAGGGAPTGINAYNVSVSSVELDFTQRQSALRVGAEQRGCLAHSGAMTGWYDGTAEVEIGFVAAPVISGYTPANVGGSMVDGTYLYQVVWEWRDERGNLHQSAPSLPLTVTLVGGTATQQVTLDVETLALTRKGDTQDGVAKDVTLQVYRTVSTGTLYIRETVPRGGTSNAVVNDKSFATVSYVDTLSDAQLSALGYGFLYTTGDVLENQLAPAARAIVSTKSRLWLASAENPRELWFSKVAVGGEGPGFNGALVITLDDANDEITALAAMDEKVVVFTRDRVYYLDGDGPNDTGGGGAFNGPFRIPVDIGCADQRSVVTYPEGVLYWDGSQLQRLTRGLAIEGFGDPVLDVTDPATGIIGKLDAANSRAWFLVNRDVTTEDKSVFAVLDYKFGQWVTQQQWGTRDEAPDGPVRTCAQHWINGEQWVGTDEPGFPSVGLTNYGLFAGYDTLVWFPATLETPWIHVAGVNGYQRVWDVTITGRRLTQHNLVIEVYTDYDMTTVRQTMTVDAQAGSPMLGLDVERLSLRIKPQLCSAIKFRIYDTAPADPVVLINPTGWDVAGLTLGVGVKPGGARLPALNRG